MSTRSSIAVVHSDGQVHVIYCLFVGYPKGVGKCLTKNYSTQDKAEALVALGDISSLAQSIDKPEGHSYDSQIDGYTVAYGRDRGETDIEARKYSNSDTIESENQAYNYLWDGSEWICKVGKY